MYIIISYDFVDIPNKNHLISDWQLGKDTTMNWWHALTHYNISFHFSPVQLSCGNPPYIAKFLPSVIIVIIVSVCYYQCEISAQ